MLILSVGENCMPGMVLRRFGISNTWSTPYTYARSNISCALMWEKEEYEDLLNRDYICKKVDSPFPKLYRNIKYVGNIKDNLFERSVSCGFEFTHHNIIDDGNKYESYCRKIDRMKKLRNSKEEVLFIYHHRYVKNDNIDKVIALCDQFVEIYDNRDRKCNIVIMHQQIIKDNFSRNVLLKNTGRSWLCTFYTENIWGGNGNGFISGEIDDDLFIECFKKLHYIGLIDNISFLDNYHCSLKCVKMPNYIN